MSTPAPLRLKETSPGIYTLTWVVPTDVDPGTYELTGTLVVDSTLQAVTPSALLKITPPPEEAITGPGGAAPPPCPTEPTRPPGGPSAPSGQAPPLAAAPGAAYIHQGLRPEVVHWVTSDDSVVIGVRNSLSGVVLAVSARLWVPPTPPGGDIDTPWPLYSPIALAAPEGFGGGRSTFAPPTDRSLTFLSLPLASGYLVSVAVVVISGSPLHGQCLVTGQIQRGTGGGAVTYGVLFQDYVTAMKGAGWPPGRIISGVEGPGFWINRAPATPGAGQELVFTVPAFTRWRIRKVGGVLTTSSQVANRTPNISIKDGTGAAVMGINGNITLTQSQALGFEFIQGLPVMQNNNMVFTGDLWFPLLLEVPAGFTISTSTVGLQTLDQWTGGVIYVEEVIDN